MNEPLVTRPALRLAALRAALQATGFVAAALSLVLLPERGFVAGSTLALHALLVGLLAFPAALAERAVAGRPTLHLAAAALLGVLALLGSSLAWTQARYTEAALSRGSIDAGLEAVQTSGGPISRRAPVATTLFVAPALATGLAALLELRNVKARHRALVALAGPVVVLSFLGWSGEPVRRQLHLVGYGLAMTLVATLAPVGAVALDRRVGPG